MQNLTKKQMEIIEDLKDQFSQINVCREVSNANPLLAYASELESIKRAENAERAIIVARNNAIMFSYNERLEADFDYLNELLSEIDSNIEIEIESFIRTKNIKISYQNIEIYIHYTINYHDQTNYKYAENTYAIDNIELSYKAVTYQNIREVIESDDFSGSFKQLLNRLK
jgi:hypothetical protein